MNALTNYIYEVHGANHFLIHQQSLSGLLHFSCMNEVGKNINSAVFMGNPVLVGRGMVSFCEAEQDFRLALQIAQDLMANGVVAKNEDYIRKKRSPSDN